MLIDFLPSFLFFVKEQHKLNSNLLQRSCYYFINYLFSDQKNREDTVLYVRHKSVAIFSALLGVWSASGALLVHSHCPGGEGERGGHVFALRPRKKFLRNM